jgi:thymidylate synthase
VPDYYFKDVNDALPNILDALLRDGHEVGSRNGRVKEFINNKIVLANPLNREVLHPNRKASLTAQIAETMWVLRGSNEIEWLSEYLPRAKDFSDDGSTWRAGYGPRLRAYGGSLDQLKRVVDDLSNSALSRQAVIEIADMSVDSLPGKDIPCTRSIQFLSRFGELHVTVTMRSNDVMWGWSGINAFEWSVVQEIVASMLGLKVGTLTFNAGSLHLYEHHWNRAAKIAETHAYHLLANAPRFNDGRPLKGGVGQLDDLITQWFDLEQKIRTGQQVSELVNTFPEPMFRAWLRVIQWYWSQDERYIDPLIGTPLHAAALTGAARSLSEGAEASVTDSLAPAPIVTDEDAHKAFQAFVFDLHKQKHDVYGDSWKRRGEMLGIMANIARKVDRLGVGGAGDTAADTVIDLLVYLAKYRSWLFDLETSGTTSDDVNAANDFINILFGAESPDSNADLVERLQSDFDDALQGMVERQDATRSDLVDEMMLDTYVLALRLWYAEQDEYKGADHD